MLARSSRFAALLLCGCLVAPQLAQADVVTQDPTAASSASTQASQLDTQATADAWKADLSALVERFERGGQDLQPAGVVPGQRLRSRHHMQRCPLLGPRLGQQQAGVLEIETGQ